MTPEAQRIAIAEACGFQKWKSKSGKVYLRMVSKHQGDYYRDCGDGLTSDAITQPLTGVPDYLNDLNAMHEAVMFLREKKDLSYANYHEWLIKIIARENSCNFDTLYACDAAASQRAEAYLHAIEKWVEE